jgi:hypothetical protein
MDSWSSFGSGGIWLKLGLVAEIAREEFSFSGSELLLGFDIVQYNCRAVAGE